VVDGDAQAQGEGGRGGRSGSALSIFSLADRWASHTRINERRGGGKEEGGEGDTAPFSLHVPEMGRTAASGLPSSLFPTQVRGGKKRKAQLRPP